MARIFRLLRDRMQMMRDDALAVAKVVEEAFQGHSELEDELLDPELRQVFYDLQDAQVLDVKRREYEEDGRVLRGYRWFVPEGEAVVPAGARAVEVDETARLYETLQDDAWARRPHPQL